MENFSQIMDPDYANMAYQNETNNVIDDLIDSAAPQEKYESFATMPSDVTEPTNIPEQIFEDTPCAVAQPNSDEGQNVPDAVEQNKVDATDSMETSQTETNQTDVPDASTNAPEPVAESAASEEASAENDGDQKDENEGDQKDENDGVAEQKVAEEEPDDSTSLMVPDEKTKRIDAVEEEINKNQCRICLSTDNLVDIYKFYDEKKLQICDLVTKLCPSLRIHERDYLPQFVCDNCEDRLSKAYELKLQCEATDRELRSKLPRRKRKARSVTEFVMIDCKELSSESDEEDKDQDDDEFHLSEEISSSSELDSEVSSEEEKKKRPPPKRARKQPPKPPPKRQVIVPTVTIHKAPATSKKFTPVSIGNIKVERIDADRKPVSRLQHFQCSICRKTFTDRTVFNNHVQKHREEKERTCVQCRQTFASINELQKHMKSHHNKQRQTTPSGNSTNNRRRNDHEPPANGERDLFKTVAPLTTTYWSDSFSD